MQAEDAGNAKASIDHQDMSDLDHDIAKAGEELERMGDKETELKVTIKSLGNTSLKELLSMRNAESEAFKQTLNRHDGRDLGR